MLQNDKFRCGTEAVDGHMVEFSLVTIAPLGQPGYIGKNSQASVRPVSGVPLPEVLGAVRP